MGLVVTGICTAFLDLLVTPILTLGLPLAVWLLDRRVREDTPLRRCGVVCGGALCWGAGYALCWASKWVLASLVTGAGYYRGMPLHQVSVRTSADTWHGMELTWGNIIRFVWDTLSSHGLLIPLLLLVVICIGGLCAVPAQQGSPAPRPAPCPDGAVRPGLAVPSAHPLHPARLVYLAGAGRYPVCRLCLCLAGLQPEIRRRPGGTSAPPLRPDLSPSKTKRTPDGQSAWDCRPGFCYFKIWQGIRLPVLCRPGPP